MATVFRPPLIAPAAAPPRYVADVGVNLMLTTLAVVVAAPIPFTPSAEPVTRAPVTYVADAAPNLSVGALRPAVPFTPSAEPVIRASAPFIQPPDPNPLGGALRPAAPFVPPAEPSPRLPQRYAVEYPPNLVVGLLAAPPAPFKPGDAGTPSTSAQQGRRTTPDPPPNLLAGALGGTPAPFIPPVAADLARLRRYVPDLPPSVLTGTLLVAPSLDITFVGSSSVDLATASSADPGLPAGAHATDVLIAVMAQGVTDNSTPALSAPSGWTPIFIQQSSANGTTERLVVRCWWAPGSVASTAFSSTGTWATGVVITAWSSVDAAHPIDAVGSAGSSTGVSAASAAAVTTVTDRALELIAVADWNRAAFSATNFTTVENGGGAPANQSAGVLYKSTPQSPAGSTGTAVITAAAGTTANQIIVRMPFALRWAPATPSAPFIPPDTQPTSQQPQRSAPDIPPNLLSGSLFVPPSVAPFTPPDLAVPLRPARYLADIPVDLLASTLRPIPFVSTETQAAVAHPQRYAVDAVPNLLVGALSVAPRAPIVPADLPAGSLPRGRFVADQRDSPNVGVLAAAPPTAVPFKPTDWPSPMRPAPRVTPDAPPNLLAAPIPVGAAIPAIPTGLPAGIRGAVARFDAGVAPNITGALLPPFAPPPLPGTVADRRRFVVPPAPNLLAGALGSAPAPAPFAPLGFPEPARPRRFDAQTAPNLLVGTLRTAQPAPFIPAVESLHGPPRRVVPELQQLNLCLSQPTVAAPLPAIYLSGIAQRTAGVAGCAQGTVAATGSVQRDVRVTGSAGAGP